MSDEHITSRPVVTERTVSEVKLRKSDWIKTHKVLTGIYILAGLACAFLMSAGILRVADKVGLAQKFAILSLSFLVSAAVIYVVTAPAWLKEGLEWIRINKLNAAMWVFILLGVAMFLFSALLFFFDMWNEAFTDTGERMYTEERWAIMLLFPALIFFLIASLFYALKERTVGAWRHAGYQITAFIILALSLHAFANPNSHSIKFLWSERVEAENGTTQTSGETQKLTQQEREEAARKAVAEMAAVMILFVLAELAAFVGRDVYRATDSLEDMTKKLTGMTNELGQMQVAVSNAATDTHKSSEEIKGSLNSLKDTAEGIDEKTTERIAQLTIAANAGNLHPSMYEDLVNLIGGWSLRVPSVVNETASVEDQLSSDCWRTLLRQYLKEELIDFKPESVIPEGIPESVQPLYGTVKKDVSYLATNVGFYAKFLGSLVQDLAQANQANKENNLCVAIVTNVLPAHWWNWPMKEDEWYRYGPIISYRQSLAKAVESGAKVDRVILVNEDSLPANGKAIKPVDGLFWSHATLTEMLNDWFLLVNTDPNEDSVPCESGYREYCNLKLNADYDYPEPVRRVAEKTSERRVIPLVYKSSNNGAPALYVGDRDWAALPLKEEYRKLHGKHGKCWALPISKENDPFDHRYDIMFIGQGQITNGERGLWAANANCHWGMCLMSSMSPTTETMFLTTITGPSVKLHYEWVRRKLVDRRIRWEEDLLRPQAPPPAPGDSGNTIIPPQPPKSNGGSDGAAAEHEESAGADVSIILPSETQAP